MEKKAKKFRHLLKIAERNINDAEKEISELKIENIELKLEYVRYRGKITKALEILSEQ